MHNAASVSASLGSLGLLRFFGVSWSWSLAAGFGVYFGIRSWKYFYIAACTAKRDLNGLYVLLRVKVALWRYMRNGSNIPSIFAKTVKLHPNKPALIYEATGEAWTFTQLDELSNAVGHWARDQGWVPGDVVALFMESRPLQVALWLGLAKVGIEAALINFNLRQDSLLHCLGVSKSRAIVFGAELANGREEPAWFGHVFRMPLYASLRIPDKWKKMDGLYDCYLPCLKLLSIEMSFLCLLFKYHLYCCVCVIAVSSPSYVLFVL